MVDGLSTAAKAIKARAKKVGKVVVPRGGTFRGRTIEERQIEAAKAGAVAAPEAGITQAEIQRRVSREIRVRALTKDIKQTIPLLTESPRIPVKKKPTATISADSIVVRPSRAETRFEKLTGRRLPPEAEAAIFFPEGKLEKFAVATGLLAVSPKTITKIGLAFEFTQPEIAAPLITIGTALEIPFGLITTTVTRGPLATAEQVVFGTAKFFTSPL